MSRDGTGRAGPPPDSGEPTPVTAGDRPLVSVPSDEERSRILDQLPVPVAYFGRDMVLALANRAAGESVDRPVASLLGLLPGEIEPGLYLEGGKGLVEAIERVLRTGQAEPYETQLTMKGSEHIWQAAMSPVRDAAGEVQGVSVVILDTTEQVRARRRLALLNKAGMRIGSTLDVGRTAEELAELAVEDFADFVTVDLLSEVVAGDEARSVLHRDSINFHRAAQCSVLEGCPESVVAVGDTHAYEPDSVVGRTLIKGEPTRMVLDDAALRRWTTIEPARSQSMRDHRIHSVMVVPLKARGIILGTTLFCRHRTPGAFSAADLQLAAELVSRAAVCVDNARRYTRERATALALQRSLLPRRAARQRAVEVTARYLPNADGAGIGGDWFDVIPLSGARVALVVGDVVGHGLHAAATMGRLRTAVRTLADVDLAPDELLTQLDDLALALDREQPADGPEGGQVAGATCLYAVYDPATGHCTMARAGHPEPVVTRPGGSAELLRLPPGPPLGVGGLPFESAEFELPENSRIALYTDGLIETAGRDTAQALAELRDLLGRPARSIEEACDTVMESLVTEHPNDDVALLLARTRRLDADHYASWDLPSDPAVVSDARRRAAAQLAAWGLDDAVFTTELVVSELVTNAIRYGGDPIRLRLIRDTALICEVFDGSSTAPHLRRARMLDEGGRGLLLVASLTERWGTRYTGTGKTIWAEQPLPVVEEPDPA
ncbi:MULTISPECIES: SpoIIE family protein phosphatase [Streptomyces]|uniref:SpoIIE family protein phosphatase n=1 Tax=Streptomyces glycanivorans TaxID=3033808 RepID=A0ABY9JKR7_9ACTN|nr:MULTISPECIES: SpoIIE family protein phosphatase [unclassified Streptomyces]TXS13102.1 GAF domain-containing protein [Streptomyces sp. wa22]WLQ68302.1 SpoIIE family protein phosphatase [Streptomyces sp. Alt3]WSR05010.1 SpoIIE family protein phosphatase [Streptomyces sp. NBC_01208]